MWEWGWEKEWKLIILREKGHAGAVAFAPTKPSMVSILVRCNRSSVLRGCLQLCVEGTFLINEMALIPARNHSGVNVSVDRGHGCGSVLLPTVVRQAVEIVKEKLCIQTPPWTVV